MKIKKAVQKRNMVFTKEEEGGIYNETDKYGIYRNMAYN